MCDAPEEVHALRRIKNTAVASGALWAEDSVQRLRCQVQGWSLGRMRGPDWPGPAGWSLSVSEEVCYDSRRSWCMRWCWMLSTEAVDVVMVVSVQYFPAPCLLSFCE